MIDLNNMVLGKRYYRVLVIPEAGRHGMIHTVKYEGCDRARYDPKYTFYDPILDCECWSREQYIQPLYFETFEDAKASLVARFATKLATAQGRRAKIEQQEFNLKMLLCEATSMEEQK